MYKQKLIDLLKSDEQVKQRIDNLEFWCKIKYDTDEYIFLCYTNYKLDTLRLLNDDLWIEEIEEKYAFEIIWLPLQERFLRMYCENNIDIVLKIEWDWRIYFWDEFLIELDNTKNFDNQSEEVYQKIYETLLELKK